MGFSMTSRCRFPQSPQVFGVSFTWFLLRPCVFPFRRVVVVPGIEDGFSVCGAPAHFMADVDPVSSGWVFEPVFTLLGTEDTPHGVEIVSLRGDGVAAIPAGHAAAHGVSSLIVPLLIVPSGLMMTTGLPRVLAYLIVVQVPDRGCSSADAGQAISMPVSLAMSQFLARYSFGSLHSSQSVNARRASLTGG